jgi:hypothetical protein
LEKGSVESRGIEGEGRGEDRALLDKLGRWTEGNETHENRTREHMCDFALI